MKLEELKKVWKKQGKREDMDYSQSELMMLINNKMVSLERQIKSRDRREIMACIFVIIAFGVILFTTDSIWQQAGSIIIIGSAIYIWYKLKTAQWETIDADPSPNKPMDVHLKYELRSLKRQKKLLRSIVWWYILPPTTGLLLFTMGFKSGIETKLIYVTVVILFGGVVWKLNRRAANRKFGPLIREVKNAIEFIEKEQGSKNRNQDSGE